MLHAGTALKSWFNKFLSFCMRQFKLPKIWRRALVVAILKPNKPTANPKSYRSISLLCIAYKILERLIYARVTPIMDQLPPRKQAGFRRGKSTGDQIIFLTQKLRRTFQFKRRPVLCLLTSQEPTILQGIVDQSAKLFRTVK